MKGRVPSDRAEMLVVGVPEWDRVLDTALAMRPAMECGNAAFGVLSPHVPTRPFARGMPPKTPNRHAGGFEPLHVSWCPQLKSGPGTSLTHLLLEIFASRRQRMPLRGGCNRPCVGTSLPFHSITGGDSRGFQADRAAVALPLGHWFQRHARSNSIPARGRFSGVIRLVPRECSVPFPF